MWKDRIKLKRLKERPKIATQQAAEKQKPKQTTEIKLGGSRAQDGILKYMEAEWKNICFPNIIKWI